MIRIIKPGDPFLAQLMTREPDGRDEKAAAVAAIINRVKLEGDQGVCNLTREFDGIELAPEALKVTEEEIAAATAAVNQECMAALLKAAENITRYHQKQFFGSWFEPGADGTVLGQLVRPLARVGIYVPGGTASYPSSVLMNALPAKVAGVPEIVMVTPPGQSGQVNPYTLAAANLAGVTEIYRIGGAQAVAALAYGTQTIRAVDKITGPGNVYVTLAKQQVFGQVDIDMLAGPSEVLVVADETADPSFVAADLLSQAEHDPLASAILVTTDLELARQVQEILLSQLDRLPRQSIARTSLARYGAIVVTKNLEQALDLANQLAPEHLELLVREPFQWLGSIQNAGAVFLGPHTPEPVGDYLAGPNHILPTGGTARFFSPLGVHTFLKRTSVVYYSATALKDAGPDIIRLAGVEGLNGHAASVQVRLDSLAGKTNKLSNRVNTSPASLQSSGKPPELNGFPPVRAGNLGMPSLPGLTPVKETFGNLPGKSPNELRSGGWPGFNDKHKGENSNE